MTRNSFTATLRYLTAGLLMLGFWNGCTEPPDSNRITVENDLSILAERVTQLNEIVELDTSVQDSGLGKGAVKPVTITLVTEVESPVLEGEVLQATDVYVKANIAYVSYNMAGDKYLGAVDVFDVSDEEQPELISSMYFNDSDVNGLAYSNDHLYLAMATSRSEFETPAVVEMVKLKKGQLSDETESFDMPSFAATDVEVTASRIFVTSGADGGYVSVINDKTHAVEESKALEDARGVNTDGNDVAAVAGTPARILRFDYQSGELLGEYELTGANIPFSKSTIEVYKGMAVVALGDGGVKVVCLEGGDVVATIAPPVVADLDPTLTVANAATTSGKMLYMSNGEAGVYVAYSKDKFDSKSCNLDDLQMVGSFRFDDMQSVNHVKVDGDYLYVAGGLGGLKILKVKELK